MLRVQPAPQVEEETPAVESEATEQKEEATQQEEQTEVVSKPKRRPKKVQEPVTETAEPEAAALKNLPFMEEPVVSEKKTRRKLTLEKISVQENTEE